MSPLTVLCAMTDAVSSIKGGPRPLQRPRRGGDHWRLTMAEIIRRSGSKGDEYAHHETIVTADDVLVSRSGEEAIIRLPFDTGVYDVVLTPAEARYVGETLLKPVPKTA